MAQSSPIVMPSDGPLRPSPDGLLHVPITSYDCVCVGVAFSYPESISQLPSSLWIAHHWVQWLRQTKLNLSQTVVASARIKMSWIDQMSLKKQASLCNPLMLQNLDPVDATADATADASPVTRHRWRRCGACKFCLVWCNRWLIWFC